MKKVTKEYLTQTLKDFMGKQGLSPTEDLICDGKLHRVDADGDKPGSKNMWYVVHWYPNPNASFGSWKTGLKYTWWLPMKQPNFTPEERIALKARIDAEREVFLEATKAKHKHARIEANRIWKSLPWYQGFHQYLFDKEICGENIKMNHENELIIPLQDVNGKIHSLQFISPNGDKRFLPGGRKSGCFHLMGEIEDVVNIAEGYATAATIYEVSQQATVMACDAGNLMAVGLSLREKYPDAKIIFCADNDTSTKGNPGKTKAIAAALAVGGEVRIAPPGMDFNDLYCSGGYNA